MKIHDIVEGKSENRELWDRIKSKGVVPSIDRERYTDMSGEGLEGPFRMKNGQVLYYDPKEGKYYNRDTDMYVDYEDYRAMNEEDSKNVGAEIADLIRKKNSASSPVARKNIDSQIAQLKKQRDKTNEEDAYDKDVKTSGKPHDKEAAAKRAKAAALAAAKKAKEQGVAEGDKRPDYVVKASDKPKKVKPSMGGSSAHPYQGKLVGEAEVSNTDYEFTHGKKPSGQGSWFFVAHRGGINFSKDVEGEDYVELHGMSYSDAKKAAVKWAKSKGHTSLFVAT